MNYLKGIDNFFRFFMDPITRDILEQMNEPTNTKDLLIRATQLLSTEDYREVSSAQNHRVRSYERLPAILYNQIARQLSNHVNTRSRKTGFTIHPTSVYKAILEDRAFLTVDELNPIKSLKESTNFTYVGMGGRTNKAFVKQDRVYPSDGMGIVSETTPTSQNVALVAGMPLDPVTFNTRGFFKIPEEPSKLESSQYLDPVSMLIPGLTQDDPKRANFCSIQLTHVCPTQNYEVGRLRTGFESVLAHRTSNLFATVAEDDGQVVDIDPKLNLLKVKYKNGSVKIIDVTTKYTDSDGTNIAQKLVINSTLKIGSKFNKSTVLSYNPEYFEEDSLVPTQVNWKIGTYRNVVLMENDETYEDSCVISEELSKKLAIQPVHRKIVSITPNTQIFKITNIGEHINSVDPIMSFEELDMDMAQIQVSEAEVELFEKLDRRLPKAGYTGTIVDIDTYYNVNLSEMHPSLRTLVNQINKVKELKYQKGKNTDSSNTFLPPTRLPNTSKFKEVSFKSPTVAIIFYIQETHDANVGDKIIFGTSLKSIVSNVVNTPMTTKSGKKIDAQFASSGIMNRIVTTPFVIGCTQTIMEELEKNIIDLYFK
jgi:hypothetical protein